MKTKNIYAIIGCLVLSLATYSQSRLILNGATVTLSNGACLVVDNADTNALTRNSGSIVSEGEDNRIQWSIGTSAASYTVPFGYSTDYVPVRFTTNGATGAGALIFSTYRTGWKNTDYLPTGVTNMRGQMPDHSAFALDRFWQLKAVGYTTKPGLTNVTFTYTDAEHQAAGNTIDESSLGAQQWNNTLSVWDNAQAGGIMNATNNTVTIASVPASSFYQWWSLTDQLNPLATRLLSFTAEAVKENALLNWTGTSETDGFNYILQRSKDATHFETITTLKGNSTTNGVHRYQYLDTGAYKGYSYYRLKLMEKDGQFHYSAVRRILINKTTSPFTIHPNPVINKECTVRFGYLQQQPCSLSLVDDKGAIVASLTVPAGVQSYALKLPANLPAGMYIVSIGMTGGTQQQKILVY